MDFSDITDPRQFREVLVKSGDIKGGVPWLRDNWGHERCERVVAEVGDEGQELEVLERRGNHEIRRKHVGWRRVFETTGIAHGRNGDMDIWAVAVDGGRNGVGRLEGMKIVVGVYRGERCLTTGKALVLEDETEMLFDGKRRPELEVKLREELRLVALGDEAGAKMVHAGIPEKDRVWIKRKEQVKVSAVDKLLKLLEGLKVEEKTTTEVTIASVGAA